jgi:hypothetical protein
LTTQDEWPSIAGCVRPKVRTRKLLPFSVWSATKSQLQTLLAQPAAAVPSRSLAASCALFLAHLDSFFSSDGCHSLGIDLEPIPAHQLGLVSGLIATPILGRGEGLVVGLIFGLVVGLIFGLHRGGSAASSKPSTAMDPPRVCPLAMIAVRRAATPLYPERREHARRGLASC